MTETFERKLEGMEGSEEVQLECWLDYSSVYTLKWL